jgi:hypothetical protein
MERTTEDIIKSLFEHPEPLVRLKTSLKLLGYALTSSEISNLKQDLPSSPLLQGLLSDQKEDGRIPYHPYDKWFGAHWILSILADLGYPEGDSSLKPLLDQSYEWLLSNDHESKIQTIEGRVRRCASQEGNCVYYSIALGLADQRTEELVTRLIKWQWEDGGWNCDKRPEAAVCSFNESLIPLRGMFWYANASGDPKARAVVNDAAHVFLKRNLFKRIRDGRIIDQNFVALHYPNYWHYDVLFALKVLGEAGFISDPGCNEALDLLESKRLPDGGFPAEGKYYRVDDKKLSGHSRVDWGGISKIRSNPFVTMDALIALKQSGRLVLTPHY